MIDTEIRMIAAPKTVLTPGIDTGSRNGSVRSAQSSRNPCSPISVISSRRVIVSPRIEAIMPLSVSLRLRCVSPNSIAIKSCLVFINERRRKAAHIYPGR
ncbi:hypothetical protein D9M70_651470 [compost metagenome]